jgi:CBS domain-containing protein
VSLETVKVTEVMTRPVLTVTPGTAIKEAARILIEAGVSALPVLNPKGDLVGIVSEADLVGFETRPDPRAQAMPMAPTAGTTPRFVRDVMTRHVITVPLDAQVSRAARTMLEQGIKRVPVVSGRRVVGIVSRRDLVKVIARQDDVLRADVAEKLDAAGIGKLVSSVTVDSGIVLLEIGSASRERRLAESIALAVPGVFEVRFKPPHSKPTGR